MEMSAFALYLAGIITDENKMQRDIADTAEAIEVTLG
jgi:transcription initiation factor TFIIIB Brf1 subunit/transcription initiation factor TFIIB